MLTDVEVLEKSIDVRSAFHHYLRFGNVRQTTFASGIEEASAIIFYSFT
jgi:hypothetical protein